MSSVRACRSCHSTGSTNVKAGKSAIFHYKKQCQEALMLDLPAPPMPQRVVNCDSCNGLGILDMTTTLPTDNLGVNLSTAGQPAGQHQPAFTGKICVIGGGIGGLAFALAGLHRGLDVTVYEKDADFTTRSQGYALTMQQGFTQLRKLGFSIEKLREIGTTSTCHITLDTQGEVIGRTGRDRWEEDIITNSGEKQKQKQKESKRFNIQLPRQYLRQELLEPLPEGCVQWGKKLISLNIDERKVYFSDHTTVTYDLIVGADGIWSQFTLPQYPLTYLGVIVILGRGRITTTNDMNLGVNKIWQTVDGVSRMYAMPFGIEGETMWQLSWQCSEKDAKAMGGKSSLLLTEAKRRVADWHDPWAELLESTRDEDVTGYPAYDRWPLPTFEALHPRVVVLGDAAHPLSPFKGQGANQALADGVELATILCVGSDNKRKMSENKSCEHQNSESEGEMMRMKVSGSRDVPRLNLKRTSANLNTSQSREDDGNDDGKDVDDKCHDARDGTGITHGRDQTVIHKPHPPRDDVTEVPVNTTSHSKMDISKNSNKVNSDDKDDTVMSSVSNSIKSNTNSTSDQYIQHLIQTFHKKMLARVSVKVKQSREATGVLHSPAVLIKGDRTRGKLHDGGGGEEELGDRKL